MEPHPSRGRFNLRVSSWERSASRSSVHSIVVACTLANQQPFSYERSSFIPSVIESVVPKLLVLHPFYHSFPRACLNTIRSSRRLFDLPRPVVVVVFAFSFQATTGEERSDHSKAGWKEKKVHLLPRSWQLPAACAAIAGYLMSFSGAKSAILDFNTNTAAISTQQRSITALAIGA
ncbi:hypothetical protein OPV22_023714 [Ensete ventricosum]|uniref:Uncharacterized protein n=1 Tax=Ensete ventricosum TaxID=4639 RepID=A0AAV8QTK2_ENSVE|nr:hypothetical protein OPV22_023714 [Ensete ventricosum]